MASGRQYGNALLGVRHQEGLHALTDATTRPNGGVIWQLGRLIAMTHVPETGDINQLHFLAPVSGTCVMHIWHRIRLVPDSGAD